jgi:hypothetical protein
MARRGSRKTGIFRRVYSPINHLILAGRNVGKSVFKRGGIVVDQTLGAVGNTGSAVVSHADNAVRNLIKSRRGGSRRGASRRGASRRKRNNTNLMNMNRRNNTMRRRRQTRRRA